MDILDIKSNNISTNKALSIAKNYTKGPHSRAALYMAGNKCSFCTKLGSSIIFNKSQLIRYCELSNKPTLLDIAKQLKISVGSIKYIAMKHNIPFREEMGRKYLEQTDADKLIRLYKEHHNG